MSTCTNCGGPCQGQLCRACEVELAAEEHHGVPEDNFEDEEADG